MLLATPSRFETYRLQGIQEIFQHCHESQQVSHESIIMNLNILQHWIQSINRDLFIREMSRRIHCQAPTFFLMCTRKQFLHLSYCPNFLDKSFCNLISFFILPNLLSFFEAALKIVSWWIWFWWYCVNDNQSLIVPNCYTHYVVPFACKKY